MRFLAHLSGEHPEMAAAEFRALFDAVGKPLSVLREAPTFLDGHAEVFADEAETLLRRLGLAHLVCYHLFDGVPGNWPREDAECCLPAGVRFAVRAVRVDAKSPYRSAQVEREVGAALQPGRRIDLKRPELRVRAFLLRDAVAVGRDAWQAEPGRLRARHVENRPYFSPVSLEPKWARALLNLARVPPGGTVCDPMCGTGGLLLEAADMGLRPVGSDLEPEMVAGSRANLEHFGLSANATLFASDVGRAPEEARRRGLGPFDAVVADLPYGRSASTGKEKPASLYARAFEAMGRLVKPDGLVVVGVPTEADLVLAEDWLRRVELYKVRRHRSLTRHFAVLRPR